MPERITNPFTTTELIDAINSIEGGGGSSSYTAGDWININNNKISVKGDNNTDLEESNQLYAVISNDDYSIFYIDNPLINYQSGDVVNFTVYIINSYGEINTYFTNTPFTYDGEKWNIDSSIKHYLPSVSYALDGTRFGRSDTQTIPVTKSLLYLYRNSQYDGQTHETSDELLSTQKAIKTYVDKKASFTHNSDTQMMIIGGTE